MVAIPRRNNRVSRGVGRLEGIWWLGGGRGVVGGSGGSGGRGERGRGRGRGRRRRRSPGGQNRRRSRGPRRPRRTARTSQATRPGRRPNRALTGTSGRYTEPRTRTGGASSGDIPLHRRGMSGPGTGGPSRTRRPPRTRRGPDTRGPRTICIPKGWFRNFGWVFGIRFFTIGGVMDKGGWWV